MTKVPKNDKPMTFYELHDSFSVSADMQTLRRSLENAGRHEDLGILAGVTQTMNMIYVPELHTAFHVIESSTNKSADDLTPREREQLTFGLVRAIQRDFEIDPKPQLQNAYDAMIQAADENGVGSHEFRKALKDFNGRCKETKTNLSMYVPLSDVALDILDGNDIKTVRGHLKEHQDKLKGQFGADIDRPGLVTPDEEKGTYQTENILTEGRAHLDYKGKTEDFDKEMAKRGMSESMRECAETIMHQGALSGSFEKGMVASLKESNAYLLPKEKLENNDVAVLYDNAHSYDKVLSQRKDGGITIEGQGQYRLLNENGEVAPLARHHYTLDIPAGKTPASPDDLLPGMMKHLNPTVTFSAEILHEDAKMAQTTKLQEKKGITFSESVKGTKWIEDDKVLPIPEPAPKVEQEKGAGEKRKADAEIEEESASKKADLSTSQEKESAKENWKEDAKNMAQKALKEASRTENDTRKTGSQRRKGAMDEPPTAPRPTKPPSGAARG